jgi:hypothetical protein
LNGLKKTEPEEDRIFKLADSTHFQTAADSRYGMSEKVLPQELQR